MDGDRAMMASATMLAATTSYRPSTLSTKSPCRMVRTGGVKPLSSPFSLAVFTARGSMSTPTAFSAPSSKAAIDNIPLPQPTSSSCAPGLTASSRASSTRRVVS